MSNQGLITADVLQALPTNMTELPVSVENLIG